jgi:hypothetical protein
VWRWNGKDYEHLRNDPDEPGGCDYVDKAANKEVEKAKQQGIKPAL